jgi:transposase
MLRCRNELRSLEKQIDSHCRRMPDVAAMAAVVGPLAAATLLSALGKPEDYDSAGAWLKAAGLNLTEHSSGLDPKNDKKLVPVAISKRGSPEVRRLLYLAALRQSKNDPVIAWWLKQKKKRDGGKAMPGVVAVMRKLMRAIWHIGRSAADAVELSGEAKAEKMQQARFQADRLFTVNICQHEADEQAA